MRFVKNLTDLTDQKINSAGTPVHAVQVEFMYAIDSVMRGSTPEVEVGINEAKRIIASLRRANK